MKRNIVIILSALLSIVGAAAQEQSVEEVSSSMTTPVNKYLPEAGDFALGLDVTPFIEFLGNAFNGYGTDGTRNTIGSLGGKVINLDYIPRPDVSIMGKYLLSGQIAARGNIGVLSRSTFIREYVVSDVLLVTDPLSAENLIDKKNTYLTGGSINAGLEYRLGKNRIQGIFGADLLFAIQHQKDTYDYGNKLTALNNRPTASAIMPAFDAAGYRTLQKKYGNTYYTGLMLNAGLEYFIAPKLAIGSEANLMLYYKFASSAYELREGLNLYTNKIEERYILTSPGNREFVLGTGNFGAKLYLMLYF